MQPAVSGSSLSWSEKNSQTFIDFGKYFVPDREEQINIICELIPRLEKNSRILELCCGEGLLAGALLERYQNSIVIGMDGSPTMLAQASDNLKAFNDRFMARRFKLAERDWRTTDPLYCAIVSSLAIHHLDGEEKRALFTDLYPMLSPGGALIIADIIQPASPTAMDMAARFYDAAVRERALAIEGNLDKYEQFLHSEWNLFRYPDEMDKPSPLFDQLNWLEEAGFCAIDIFWMKAGHAIYGGYKNG